MKPTKRIFTLILTILVLFGSISMTASAAENTVYGIGFVTASSLRLRSEPNSSSGILTRAPRNDCVVVLSKTGEWYKVNYNLQEGYMHEDYLNVSECENAELGTGRITGQYVNIRTEPSTAGKPAAVSYQDDTCDILGINSGWYKVSYKNITGYIRSDYVELTEIPYENSASSRSPRYYRLGKAIHSSAAPSQSRIPSSASPAPVQQQAVSGISGAEILAEAQRYLGVRYVSGGASPSGFDCAGLVYYVLKQTGYAPFRTPVDQYSQGTYVEKTNLKSGDIVFFAGTGANGISHVGIYAGGGQFLHAPNSRSTVSYSSLSSGYWAEHYYGARRMG